MKKTILLILCNLLATLACAQVSFFQPILSRSGLTESMSAPGVLRNTNVQMIPQVINDLATTDSGTQILMEPFPDQQFVIVLQNKNTLSNDTYTWSGHVKDAPLATFDMSVCQDAVVVDLRTPNDITYAIRYRGNGIHEIQEIAESALPACGVNPAAGWDLSPLISSLQTRDTPAPRDAPSEIDVLVAYTQDSETQAGGPSGITALINQAFSMANTAYANSQVPLSIIKCATIKVNYTPNVDMGLDLSRLRSTSDGHMDEVHAIRDAYGADMVCLLRGSSSPAACGIGYLMQSNSAGFASNCFSVVANNCISGQTFAHELGHNMGCHHDQANAGSTAIYPYAYGWRWTSGSTQYRSVMAYSPGTRTSHFSNPLVNYAGTPTGVTNAADNALTIKNTSATVANFRQRGVATSPVIMSSAATITVNIPVGTDASKIVQFGNAGSGTLSYNLSDTLAWLTITPPSATAGPLVSNSHTLNFDSDTTTIGQYNGSITVSDSESVVGPKTVPVIVNIYQPATNDHFANAQLISGATGTTTGTNRYATRQTGEANSVDGRIGQHSVWYKWVAPSNMPVTIDTVGSTFDTLLAAYTGGLGSLTQRSANDNGSGISPRSRITFTPVQSTTYYILVDAGNNVMGNITLNWASEAGVARWSEF